MSNLVNEYEKLLTNRKFQSVVSSAKEEYRFRPFVESYHGLFVLSNVSRYALPVFSLATGFSAMYYILADALPIWVAIIGAGLICVLVEVPKAETVRIAYRNFFQTRKKALLGVVALFVALSVALSLQGVKSLLQSFDTSVTDAQRNMQRNVTQLVTHYDSLVTNEKKEHQAYLTSVSWRGKIDASNKATQSRIKAHSAILEQLIYEKNEALRKLSAQHKAELELTQSGASFNMWAWLVISLLIECGIVISGWFVQYYKYRVASEAELLNKPEKHEIPVNLQESTVLNKPVSVGFSLNKTGDKIERIKQSIKEGIRDYRTLVSMHKTNPRTVRKVFEMMEGIA